MGMKFIISYGISKRILIKNENIKLTPFSNCHKFQFGLNINFPRFANDKVGRHIIDVQ